MKRSLALFMKRYRHKANPCRRVVWVLFNNRIHFSWQTGNPNLSLCWSIMSINCLTCKFPSANHWHKSGRSKCTGAKASPRRDRNRTTQVWPFCGLLTGRAAVPEEHLAMLGEIVVSIENEFEDLKTVELPEDLKKAVDKYSKQFDRDKSSG